MTFEEQMSIVAWYVLHVLGMVPNYIWAGIGLTMMLFIAASVIKNAVRSGVKEALSGLEDQIENAVREAVEEAREWDEEDWDDDA
jgi:hypothetical protein